MHLKRDRNGSEFFVSLIYNIPIHKTAKIKRKKNKTKDEYHNVNKSTHLN